MIMMKFEQLDSKTREYMIAEFVKEQESQNPYISTELNELGRSEFVKIMKNNINTGNEISLKEELSDKSFWKESGIRNRAGKEYTYRINPVNSAERLALTEFNTWYVKGLATRLLDEGESKCSIYRADTAVEPRCECTKWEDMQFDLKTIIEGHRKRYHGSNIDKSAMSIPSGPNCHHTIRKC